jgi:hypothetical protein
MRKRRLHLLLVAVSVVLSTVALAGSPAASATNRVPPRLAGAWALPPVFPGAGEQYLILADSRFMFFFHPGPMPREAYGHVSVSGDTITFFGSNVCTGTGTYRWSRTDGGLAFVRLTPDPCPRARILPAGTWRRP